MPLLAPWRAGSAITPPLGYDMPLRQRISYWPLLADDRYWLITRALRGDTLILPLLLHYWLRHRYVTLRQIESDGYITPHTDDVTWLRQR